MFLVNEKIDYSYDIEHLISNDNGIAIAGTIKGGWSFEYSDGFVEFVSFRRKVNTLESR